MALTTEQSGLRFDIYERVHLSEGVLGIKELEGVELVPHIQVLPQGEQAVLRGNLLLTGTYVDEQERAEQTLEHLIPVEITLPLSRVHRVEDIAVEIENFDVDLLSARSLNITGVLSLNGLELTPAAEPQQEWRETEEEVVFVHEAQSPRPLPGEARPGVSEEAEAVTETERVESAWAPEETEPVQANAAEAASEAAAEEFVIPAAPEPEKKEPKVAFAAKPSTPSPEAAPAPEPIVKSYGLSSLLNHSAAAQTKAEEREEETAAPAGKVEWKSILITARSDQQQFKRLRLCIVQKEDTLESIAKRYELNPRELALYNRLGDSDISEGQIVYIPK